MPTIRMIDRSNAKALFFMNDTPILLNNIDGTVAVCAFVNRAFL
jgi:hypothetical protein